jgi:BirA family biotin operon repressor/biotin-[acetyl-CoA-carboxylase] ligase
VTTGLEARIKWPNDMVVNDKKCAGILVEAGITEGALEYAILGIGINVNFAIRDYPDLAAHATTLADELGRPIGRDELARNLFDALDEYYARLCQGASLRDEWAGLLITLGQMIRAETPWGIEEGRAVDVDDEGALIVERADGSRVMLVAGEVTIEKQQGSGGAREQR